jgi:hypothetical protein
MGASQSRISEETFIDGRLAIQEVPGTPGVQLEADQEVKIYRQLRNEHAQLSANNIEPAQAYERLVQRHSELTSLYSQKSFQCPKVRFGRTELQMPILTLGGMRQQLTWNPKADLTIEQVDKDCQANFEKIAVRAMEVSYAGMS